MLRLDPKELKERFREPGGGQFTLFVNELVGNICRDAGIPPSEISTCARSDIADEGVDTKVAQGSPTDETGYLQTQTIWQFRATDEKRITPSVLKEEISQPFVKACLEQGYAYRLCVCDHIPANKDQKLLAVLNEEIVRINPSAPQAKILSVDKLADLANRYPAFVMRYRSSGPLPCRTFDSLGSSLTDVTPTFVPPSGFEARKTAILEHVDLQREVPDAILSIQGMAGVGKTRTVYESLLLLPQARNLVLYTDDEVLAVEVAMDLSNEPTEHAILLADECTVSARVRLNSILRGCKNRVRAISIDNTGELAISAAPELAVTKLTSTELEKVLRANFSHIPMERLRSYAYLSEGFVRLAADMCKRDSHIAAAGNLGPVLRSVHDYFVERLTEDQRKAVEAVALLRRVGHKDEAGAELDALCSLTSLPRAFVDEQLRSVKDGPGFVERGARYYRVTPHIIARVAFEGAWGRWAKEREEEFLSAMPAVIQEEFLKRVNHIDNAEVRNTVQKFFRRFADNFGPRDLADIRRVERLIQLIETEPSIYLPILRRVVESADHEQLIAPEQWTGSGWGPRRQLVWLAERFAQFPEFFHDAEAILYKLAVHECEPTIGNNATGIWKQLFRLQLSGTALPLATRLAVLRKRLATVDDQSAEPIGHALKATLYFMGTRTLGPPVVAGRIPPTEWGPKNLQELNEAIREGLTILKDASRHPVQKISMASREAILGAVQSLVHKGFLDQVQQVFAPEDFSEDARALLVSQLKQMVTRSEAVADEARKLTNPYLDQVQVWIGQLEPTTFHGKLVEAVGPDPWHHFGREDEWRASLTALAQTLFHDEAAFQSELDWLLSEQAKAGFEFGRQLGAMDEDGKYLGAISQKTTETANPTFPRGYVSGLVYDAKSSIEPLNRWLDSLEATAPILAFQLAHAGGDAVRLFERTVRLVKSSKLPAVYLRNFAIWVGNRKVTREEVVAILRLLLPLAKGGDTACSDVMIDFLGYRAHESNLRELLADEDERSLVWDVLTAATEHPGREAHWWSQALLAAAATDQGRATRLACHAATSDNFQLSDEAEKVVSQFATKYPEEVMNDLGALILSESVGWKFFLGKYPFFTTLPLDTVTRWLEREGVEAARRVARHLPGPSLDSEGNPILHPLTEFVLSGFEEDDRTFREFCAGVHSLQMYVGSYASARQKEAEVAEKFFGHRLRRIREWARMEYDAALRDVEQDLQEEDEMKG